VYPLIKNLRRACPCIYQCMHFLQRNITEQMSINTHIFMMSDELSFCVFLRHHFEIYLNNNQTKQHLLDQFSLPKSSIWSSELNPRIIWCAIPCYQHKILSKYASSLNVYFRIRDSEQRKFWVLSSLLVKLRRAEL
jgi:hypothetical protein